MNSPYACTTPFIANFWTDILDRREQIFLILGLLGYLLHAVKDSGTLFKEKHDVWDPRPEFTV
jgi:hypothetical protein